MIFLAFLPLPPSRMHRFTPHSASQPAFKAAVSALAVAGSLSLSSTMLQAGEPGLTGLAGKETQKRSSQVSLYQTRLAEAEALLKQGDSATALKIFEEAYLSLPQNPLAVEAREVALDGYLRAGLAQAKELADKGDYPAAHSILDRLDKPDVALGDARIQRLRARIDDPDRYPRALTPEHVAKVATVEKLLHLANSQRETGQFDKALLTYEEILRLDAYNTAARRGMEHTERERAAYFKSARDHARSKMLNGVNELWEAPLNTSSKDVSGLFGGGETLGSLKQDGRSVIQQKLRDLRIAQIDFSGATVEEVLEYLRVRARDLDPTEKGIDFVFNAPSDQTLPTVTLNLRNVPLEEVLRYMTDITGLTYKVEEFAVRIVSPAQDSVNLISKSYRVPPDFITGAPVGNSAASTTPADPFGQQGGAATSGIQIRKLGAQEFLQSYGVTFAEGASASYSPASNLLIVRNTAKNIELVDLLVEQAVNRSPKQVVIEVKLLEVGNNQLEELGFDWLLGAFGVKGGQLEGAGGSVGNGQPDSYLTNDFPFQTATGPVGQNPITAGLRSSGDLGRQGIEGVLFGTQAPASKRSPGVLSLSGVLSSPQFQVVLRALDQKKGVDLAAQPSVVTRSGQKASVEVVREFIYPTEFDPPQVPTNVGASNNNNNNNGGVIDPNAVLGQAPPPVVTPATPTAFEMRKTGVVLEVEPVISEDGRTVDLAVTPQFTEFLGFVNYGSPINSLYQGSFEELTPNLIFQPIFETKKIVTSVNIWDGATIVLGGLVTDQNEIIQDKVPVLGDVPFLGRLFKSEVKQRRIKHMVFFVTVKVVDPGGSPVNQAAAN